jgi:hypothetical protein
MTLSDNLCKIQDWKKIRVKGRKSVTGSSVVQVDLSQAAFRAVEDKQFESYCTLYTSKVAEEFTRSFDWLVFLSMSMTTNTQDYFHNFLFLEKRATLVYGGNNIKRNYFKFLNTTTSKVYWISESMVVKEMLGSTKQIR